METQHVPAIVYHQVLADGTPVRATKPGEGRYSGQVYRAQFVQHMDYLAGEGFTTLTHDQLYRRLSGREELPAKPIVVDLDDHSMRSYKNAFPVMRERGLVATMFVISGLADGDPTLDDDMWSIARMRWRELEELLKAGWEIGAHTRNHALLPTFPKGPEGDARIKYELVRGKTDIETNLGVTPRHFAYPVGLWDERVEAMVKEVYDTARHFHGWGRAEYITRETNPFRLPTMNINYLLEFEDFKHLVNRTDPDHEYYPENSPIGDEGTPA